MSHSARARIRIPAPIGRVWQAWSDPADLARWYCDRVEGALHQGGQARLIWDCYGLELPVVVEDRDAPTRLVLRADPSGRRPQHQRVELVDLGDATEVRLEHGPFAAGATGADERAGTEAGWHTMLAVLRHYLERFDGRPRRTFAVLGAVEASFPALFARFTGEAELETWLGVTPGGFGGEGTRAELHTGGSAWRGHILARTEGRELAMTCDEIDGVIALRAFALGHGLSEAKLAGCWVSSWADDPVTLAHLQRSLASAVDRLCASFAAPAPLES